MFDACLNGIFRVALKVISWASGVELNYTKKSITFYYVCKLLFLFLSRFLRFLTFFKYLFERFFTSMPRD